MANDKLSIKEQMFCNEYIKNGNNGTKAVISAGYAEQSASVQQTRLLKKDRIRRELERQNEYNLRANAISKNQIIQEQYELYQLARADERYKDASAILSELTSLLGHKPKQEDRKVLHSHVFEQLLTKDITPEKPAITVN